MELFFETGQQAAISVGWVASSRPTDRPMLDQPNPASGRDSKCQCSPLLPGASPTEDQESAIIEQFCHGCLLHNLAVGLARLTQTLHPHV